MNACRNRLYPLKPGVKITDEIILSNNQNSAPTATKIIPNNLKIEEKMSPHFLKKN
jgi:hypothetical protein